MITAVLALALGMAQDDWYSFAPDGKNFRIELPGKPDTSSRTVKSTAGQLQLTVAKLAMPDGLFSVQITENRGKVDPNTLEDGIKKSAEARKATLGPIKTIAIGASSGREFELTERSGEGLKRSKMRWVAAGNTLFMLSVTSRAGAQLPRSAERFLGSLEIGGAKAIALADADDGPKTRAKSKAADRDKVKVKAKDDDADDAPADGAEEADDEKPKSSSKVIGRNSRVILTPIPRTMKRYTADDIADLGRSFPKENPDAFRDVGPVGSVLVGVRVSYIERFGGNKVRSVQPIYRNGLKHYIGGVYGEVVAPVQMFTAKPGYAVGGIVTHTGLTVDGFGLVYMRLDGDRLDPQDSYNSPWIGDKRGGGPGQAMSLGEIVVGIQGRSSKELNALGLTVLQ